MKNIYSPLLILLLFLFCSNCNTEKKTKEKETEKATYQPESEKEVISKILYSVASPEEIFEIINDASLVYDQGLINPVDNKNKYIESEFQLLNIGTFSADLAYMIFFNDPDKNLEYFSAIKELSESVQITGIYDQNLFLKIEENLNKPDTISQIADAAFQEIVNYLIENNNEEKLAIISTGALIESIFISVKLVEKSSEKEQLVQNIVDQKITFENLYSYVKMFEKDAVVASVLKKLDVLKSAFEQFQEISDEKSEFVEKEGKTILNVTDQIKYTEAQYRSFSESVIKLRNEMTIN